MNIDISDAEKEELKKRVLANAEHKLTDELVQSMSRSVIRDGHGLYRNKVFDMLTLLLEQKINLDFVQTHFNRAVEEYMKPRDQWNQPGPFQKQLDKAVNTVVEKLGSSIGEEFKRMVYGQLHEILDRKKEKG